jgi:hypothetical protein
VELDILSAGATIFVGGLLACLLPVGMRVVRRFWRGPERQIRGALVHTEDPINDRIEIFLCKD